jgi:hypothetical protein
VTVDPREREFLAQLFRVTVVGVDVDRALEEECFVETVQLVLDGFGRTLGRRDLLAHRGLARFPDLQSANRRSSLDFVTLTVRQAGRQ